MKKRKIVIGSTVAALLTAAALLAQSVFRFPNSIEVLQPSPSLSGVSVISSGGAAPAVRWKHGGFAQARQIVVETATNKFFVDLNANGILDGGDFYLDLPPASQDLICIDCIGDTEINIDDSATLRAMLSDENGTGAALFNAATSPNFLTDVTVGGISVCLENGTNCTVSGVSFSDSAGLRAILSDENGTGAALFVNATSPNFLTDVTVGGISVCLENGTNCAVVADDDTPDNDSEVPDNITVARSKCINIDPDHTTTDWVFFRADAALTVTGIDCIVDAATSVVMTLRECNSNAASCGDTEAAITCGTTNSTEASSIDDSSVDAGDWMRVSIGTVTGSPTQAELCMTYTSTSG